MIASQRRSAEVSALDRGQDTGHLGIDEFFETMSQGLVDFATRIERDSRLINKLRRMITFDEWPRSENAHYDAFSDSGSSLLRRRACAPDTRRGDLKRIIDWAQEPLSAGPNVFWLSGLAGTGKTTIAFSVCQDLERLGALGASFFCSRQQIDARNDEYIIPTIVEQMSHCSSSFTRALTEVKHSSAHGSDRQMKNLLIAPWRKAREDRYSELLLFVVVIDALDEIEGGVSVFLNKLLEKAGDLSGLKFFVTSRPHPDIADASTPIPACARFRLHELSSHEANTDILKYLDGELTTLRGDDIIQEISRQADGLFIYAATLVRLVEGMHMSEKEIGDRLRPFLQPKAASPCSAIDEIYKQILQDAFLPFPHKFRVRRLEILRTILITEQRVSSRVIAGLLSEDEETVVATVKSLYAVLYELQGSIYWHHASFPDSIFKEERFNNVLDGIPYQTARPFWFRSLSSQHERLAHHCFRIMQSMLHFNIVNHPSSFLLDTEIDIEHRLGSRIHPSVGYSAHFWATHLCLASPSSTSLLKCLQLFPDSRLLLWIELMNLYSHGALTRASQLLRQAAAWMDQRDVELSAGVLHCQLHDALNFITCQGMHAWMSTPHLYLSSLQTWTAESPGLEMWQAKFRRYVFLGSGEGLVRARNAWTKEQQLRLTRHTGDVIAVAFSPDGRRIASGSDDQTVHVWIASTGKHQLSLTGHTGMVIDVAFLPDGRLVSGSDDETVRVWDAYTGEQKLNFTRHARGDNVVASSSVGRRIVSGLARDRTVQVWNTGTGVLELELTGHYDSVRAVAFSLDGRRVVSGSWDCTLRVWDLTVARLRGWMDQR